MPPVNLSRVNVSLQQFQSISSGKYNAGEVKLASETTLDKVNNHVSRRGGNVVPLSHEEVMAVKTAFVKALRSGGVGRDEIARVRRELGLAPETGDAVDRTLGERSMKPLTRQQVREILDRYAETINAHPGAPRIRTSAQLYARVAAADREARTALRNEVNASLGDSRTVSANRDILLFERLVAGDFDGLFQEDAERMAEMARQKLASAREKLAANPPDNQRLHVTWELQGGQKIDLLARGNLADFAAHLEDSLFLLSISRPRRGNADVPAPPPPPTNAAWNGALKSALLATNPKPLPHDIAVLEKALLADARAKFGADVIPPNARLCNLVYGSIDREFNQAVRDAGDRRIGPDDLRDRFRNALDSFGAMTTANKSLLAALGTPNIQPHHAAALVRAARDAGLTAMSEADILALFDPAKPAGRTLAEAIGASPVAVSPVLLQSLAAGALRPFAGAIHDGIASAALAAPEADFPPEARTRANHTYLKAGAEPWKADALVAAAFNACGNDAEVRALVLANLDLILVAANAELRSVASVRQRVEALRANYDELRQLAANDPELFAQGRELIAVFHGKALPAGLLGRLIQAAWEQPNAELKGISARSRGLAVHKAVVRFRENVNRAMQESGAGDATNDPNEIAACRDFLARRMFSHLARADVEGLRAALHSTTAAKLSGAYADLGAFAGNRALSDGLRVALGGTGNALRIQMFELEDSLSRHLGVASEGIPAAPDPQPRPDSFGAAGLVDDAIRLARGRLAVEKKDAVDTYVRGASPAADRLRGVFSDRLGPEPDDPESTLSDTFQAVASTMLNRAILKDMQKFETGQLTQFDLDRNRGYKIVLAGVGEVSEDPAVARDQFAKFVSRNPAATYASLDRRTRRKAHLAMAIASQGSHNAVNFGFGVMLDPQGRTFAASFAGKLGERTFTMEINSEGGLAVLFRGVQNPTHLIAGGESVPCGPGSQVEAKLDLLVSAEEQERLAGIDFAAYDDHPVAQIIDIDQPEDRYKVAKHAFPQGYRIRMDVGPRLVANLA